MKISKGTWLVVLGAVLVVLDQVIKILVKTNMELGETINVIGSWFQLHFVLNEGMAFGMAFGGVWGKALLSVFVDCAFRCLVVVDFEAGIAPRHSDRCACGTDAYCRRGFGQYF